MIYWIIGLGILSEQWSAILQNANPTALALDLYVPKMVGVTSDPNWVVKFSPSLSFNDQIWIYRKVSYGYKEVVCATKYDSIDDFILKVGAALEKEDAPIEVWDFIKQWIPQFEDIAPVYES